MLLIDTRLPPPDPPAERAAWEPNWRLWGWVALAIATGAAADAANGIVSYALLLVCVTCVCRAVCVILPPLDGMRSYRQ